MIPNDVRLVFTKCNISYYLSESGDLFRVLKNKKLQHRDPLHSSNIKWVKKQSVYLKHGRPMTKISTLGEVSVSKLVAKTFKPSEYASGRNYIFLLDKRNLYNCSLDNLILLTKEEAGVLTGGKSRGNIYSVQEIDDSKCKYYVGGRQLAKALHCSHQTVYDYFNNKAKTSVLDKYIIKKIDFKSIEKKNFNTSRINKIKEGLYSTPRNRLAAIRSLAPFSRLVRN